MEPRFKPIGVPRSEGPGETEPGGKSYLHRQRTDEQPGLLKDRGSSRSPGTDTSSKASPEMLDPTHQAAQRSPSKSSQQSRKRKQMRAAAIVAASNSRSKGSSQASPDISASNSLDRVPCGDIITDVPYPSSKTSRMATSRRPAVMTTQDSIKMQGQDTLEVRNVNMPNGQSASLVLEDGKLQRIVCSSGNVVEVWWQGNKLKSKDKGGPDRQMAIKLRTAGYSSHPEVQNNIQRSSKQGVMKKLANSLQSQRLSTAKLNSYLYSGPVGGPFTQSERNLRCVQSLDFTMAGQGGFGSPKRGDPNNPGSLQPSRTASHNDMSTILDVEGRQRSRDNWNPMNSSWLPTDMTAGKQDSGGRITSASASGQGPNVLKSSGVAPTIGTAITPADITSQQTRTAATKAPKNGLPTGKKNIWSSIKKFLHIPSKKKKSAATTTDTAVGESSQSPGEGQTRKMTAAERDRELQIRSIYPATPSSASAQNIGFQTPESSMYGPSHKSAGWQSVDRMSRSSGSLTTVHPVTPEEKLAAYVLPSTASTPAMPVASDVKTRRFRFGPTSEDKEELADVASEDSPGDVGPHRQTAESSSARGNGQRDSALVSRSRLPAHPPPQKLDNPPKQRVSLAGHWQRNFTEGSSGAKVDELLNVSSLQRLAREKTMEMQIVETDDTFELRWHIPLNGSSSKISKTDRYLKNGEVVEGARRDGRSGILRSQLTFTPEGHAHIRALQGAPYSAVFHDRLKLSTGGRRIKIEQKFQLLEPGVPPVKHFSIWQRIE